MQFWTSFSSTYITKKETLSFPIRTLATSPKLQNSNGILVNDLVFSIWSLGIMMLWCLVEQENSRIKVWSSIGNNSLQRKICSTHFLRQTNELVFIIWCIWEWVEPQNMLKIMNIFYPNITTSRAVVSRLASGALTAQALNVRIASGHGSKKSLEHFPRDCRAIFLGYLIWFWLHLSRLPTPNNLTLITTQLNDIFNVRHANTLEI